MTNAINDAASSRKAIHVSCSTHSGPAGFTEDPAAEGCEPDYIHLTGVDAVLMDAQRCGKYLTLCGEPIARSALPELAVSGASGGAVGHSREDATEDRLLRASIHLLAADGLLAERPFWSPRAYLTLCGKGVTDSDLPHATCPDEECGYEPWYYPECIRWATGWNAEAEAAQLRSSGSCGPVDQLYPCLS